MALAFLFEFPGGKQEQFDRILQQLELGGKAPPGQLFHLEGPMEGGWRVFDVWESQEALDKFFQAKLGQVLQKAGITPPQPQVWPVHQMLKS